MKNPMRTSPEPDCKSWVLNAEFTVTFDFTELAAATAEKVAPKGVAPVTESAVTALVIDSVTGADAWPTSVSSKPRSISKFTVTALAELSLRLSRRRNPESATPVTVTLKTCGVIVNLA